MRGTRVVRCVALADSADSRWRNRAEAETTRRNLCDIIGGMLRVIGAGIRNQLSTRCEVLATSYPEAFLQRQSKMSVFPQPPSLP
jgi:hypothetical protein